MELESAQSIQRVGTFSLRYFGILLRMICKVKAWVRVGFDLDKQRYECHMVLVADTSYKKNEGSVEDIIIGHPTNDIKIKGIPPELEDGGQVIVDEFVEINLGSEDDPEAIFLSAQLDQ